MAKTISIKVKVPGLNVSHDFIVPADMVVHRMILLIVRILHSEYPGAAQNTTATPTLLQASSGLAADRNSTFEQLGIPDGDTFILL